MVVWRDRLKIDQAVLAARVGLQQSAISRIENGHNRPAVERLPDFCRALGLTIEEARHAYRLCGVDLSPVMGGDEKPEAAT